MCGIAGIINFQHGQTVDKALLEALNRRMGRRGPDKSGFWYSENHQIGLAHNRLSFIDLHPRSNQPLSYLEERYTITYNGEIYNYRSLTNQLLKKGYRFQTSSDTEVIMAMYDCYGAAMLSMLRGMFAFAIWDNQEQKLFAARDSFGIKPFYYYYDNSRLVFASQVKAISEQPNFDLTPSPGGWCGFILNGSVPEPLTIYREISALKAGSYIEVNQQGKLIFGDYFSIYDEYRNIENSNSSPSKLENIDHALHESVEHHLVADVPVGLFLSSGIDSTIIASYLEDQQRDDLIAYTLDFDEFGQQKSESTLASTTAKKYSLSHKVIKYQEQDVESMLSEFFISMDQPSIDGLNVWMISKAASEAGSRAVLSGLGADEVLAGYPSFDDVPTYSRALSLIQNISKFGIPIDKLADLSITKRRFHPKLKGFSHCSKDTFISAYRIKRNLFLIHELDLFFDEAFIKQGLEELAQHESQLIKDLNKIQNIYLKVSALELDNYMKNQLLRDADWASMHHSLELRVPFIDWPLIKVCATELAKLNKPNKRDVIRTSLKGRLPEEVLMKEKTGFETPIKEWLNSMSSLQSWKSRQEFHGQGYPWARRWAYEVKNQFLN